jgi:hypothetical protein
MIETRHHDSYECPPPRPEKKLQEIIVIYYIQQRVGKRFLNIRISAFRTDIILCHKYKE